MASTSSAPGALDSVKELRQPKRQLQQQLRQQTADQGTATITTPTTTSNSIDVIDKGLQGHGARSGMCFSGGLRHLVPKFDGSQATDNMWRENILPFILQMDK